ncbi:MAG: rhodanese-like domain-containing protein [Clostridiales bacterium]|nr:rhodanese-like domain-containing protein [Clostridiales bacterium]
MTKLRKVLATICLTGIVFIGTACGSSNKVKTMDGEKLAAIEANDKKKEDYLVIDVRSEEEYDEGHIKFAINMPIDSFEENLSRIEGRGEKNIVVYCNSGKKSGEAAKILIKNGYKNVYNADGVKQYDYDLVKFGNIFGTELMELVNSEDTVILDAREQADYEKEALKGAIPMTADTVEENKEQLPEDLSTKIEVHCYSGNRSAVLAETLTHMGYTNVINVLDGTKEMDYQFE